MQDNNSEPAVTNNQQKRKKSLTIFALVLLIAAISSSFYYFNFVVGEEETEDAYVNGNLVQITPELTGTVTRINVDDGDYVKQGQPLVYLDDADANIAFENAEANLGQTVRQVRALFNDLEQAKAVVKTKTIALEQAQSDYNRRKNMVKAGGLSREELSHARDVMNSASQDLAAAKQQLQARKAAVQNTTVETHPLVKAAIANVKKTYLDKRRTVLVAPVSGYVAQRNVQVGQRISQSSTLMSVVPLNQVWVDANFKETQLTDMRLGQKVNLISDLYGDDVVFHGTVESLGIGTGSAFSVLPAQNATGNWIKVVQRLPVRIKLDAKELTAHPLRIGLSMTAEVDTSNKEGALLSRTSSDKALFKTDVYSQSLAGVESLVDRIIDENDSATQKFLAKE
ncbi:HlyD family efflux transporter periplasmic adaptor subunit [Vibrio sp. CAIM 722]|uniref:HlyD family efflux transporter periplasmic adaptor subunit n=1 Tax=Vibrio eleionomae TaxID=2653505 RepID=A0A7X4LJH1_9VIBR|nr:efflux RND transporter periplasmic adaptor subunit [Vibrio eleionomae]MZI92900.1 HlyD family efflux transporter periplasmic adaptor subunit [Vibrio eleionomae]